VGFVDSMVRPVRRAAFVLDGAGRLVAQSEISLVLRGDDEPAAGGFKELQHSHDPADGEETSLGINAEHRPSSPDGRYRATGWGTFRGTSCRGVAPIGSLVADRVA